MLVRFLAYTPRASRILLVLSVAAALAILVLPTPLRVWAAGIALWALLAAIVLAKMRPQHVQVRPTAAEVDLLRTHVRMLAPPLPAATSVEAAAPPPTQVERA